MANESGLGRKHMSKFWRICYRLILLVQPWLGMNGLGMTNGITVGLAQNTETGSPHIDRVRPSPTNPCHPNMVFLAVPSDIGLPLPLIPSNLRVRTGRAAQARCPPQRPNVRRHWPRPRPCPRRPAAIPPPRRHRAACHIGALPPRLGQPFQAPDPATTCLKRRPRCRWEAP